MEWPSRNVARGGILHPAKANYSAETHQFLKLLMEESKMSMMQKKKFNYFLRNGEPLPPLSNASSTRSNPNIPKVIIRPGTSKRRSRDTIVNSGVYERDKFHPQPRVDREREKEKLQNKMAFNKDIKVSKAKIFKTDKKEEPEKEVNRFDQLLQEIREREEWLNEMEALGQGERYRPIIEQQIQSKVREMETLRFPSNY
ncbi:hypothetical protein NQ314_019650 [Rhamnusium bicolor]|uniref:Uncharacterized protein n=1 Tax=Rhamnusium bicolor TaxID=1586634 RepID=A0AAV8WMT4_9CUCU|nr:hypothetical protein NQ314_019650 [Rhamnusium bicolor]